MTDSPLSRKSDTPVESGPPTRIRLTGAEADDVGNLLAAMLVTEDPGDDPVTQREHDSYRSVLRKLGMSGSADRSV